MTIDEPDTNCHDDWIEDCMHWHGKVLTGKHGHWCPEWDDLPIDETCPEFDACKCVLIEPSPPVEPNT